MDHMGNQKSEVENNNNNIWRKSQNYICSDQMPLGFLQSIHVFSCKYINTLPSCHMSTWPLTCLPDLHVFVFLVHVATCFAFLRPRPFPLYTPRLSELEMYRSLKSLLFSSIKICELVFQ